MPFPLLHQVFVLHSPYHECVHPDRISPETVGIENITVWQVSGRTLPACMTLATTPQKLFVPMELLPSYELGPSQCNYYNYSQEMVLVSV